MLVSYLCGSSNVIKLLSLYRLFFQVLDSGIRYSIKPYKYRVKGVCGVRTLTQYGRRRAVARRVYAPLTETA